MNKPAKLTRAQRRERRAAVPAEGVYGIDAWWTPGHLPADEPLPASLAPGFSGWFRSRSEDDGWTPWEELPADYRHPPQTFSPQ